MRFSLRKTLPVVGAIFLSLAPAVFAGSAELAAFLDQDLYLQNHFTKLGVQDAPTSPALSDEEKSVLRPAAERLWNRRYYLHVLARKNADAKELDAQKKRIDQAVRDYNHRLEDVRAARTRDQQGKTAAALAPNSSGAKENSAAPCVAAAIAQSKSTLGPSARVIAASNPVLKAAVQAEQEKENTAFRAENEPKVEISEVRRVQGLAAPDTEPAKPRLTAAAPEAPTKVNVPESPFTNGTSAGMTLDTNGRLHWMVVDPRSPSTVYSAKNDCTTVQGPYGKRSDCPVQLVRSTDSGSSWSVVSTLDPSLFSDSDVSVHLAVSASGAIAVGTHRGLSISEDGGKTFQKVAGGYSANALDVQFSKDGSRMIVGYGSTVPASDSDGKIQVFDRGSSGWRLSSLPVDDLADFQRKKSGSIMMIHAVQLDPNDPDVLYAGIGNDVLYRWTRQWGWEHLTHGVWETRNTDVRVNNIEINPKTGEFNMSSCAGAWQVTNKGSIAHVPASQVNFVKYRDPAFVEFGGPGNDDPKTTHPMTYAISIRPNQTSDRVVATASGVYVSRDSGKSWRRVTGGAFGAADQVQSHQGWDSALWLEDGTVLVSGPTGTYRFVP